MNKVWTTFQTSCYTIYSVSHCTVGYINKKLWQPIFLLLFLLCKSIYRLGHHFSLLREYLIPYQEPNCKCLLLCTEIQVIKSIKLWQNLKQIGHRSIKESLEWWYRPSGELTQQTTTISESVNLLTSIQLVPNRRHTYISSFFFCLPT